MGRAARAAPHRLAEKRFPGSACTDVVDPPPKDGVCDCRCQAHCAYTAFVLDSRRVPTVYAVVGRVRGRKFRVLGAWGRWGSWGGGSLQGLV